MKYRSIPIERLRRVVSADAEGTLWCEISGLPLRIYRGFQHDTVKIEGVIFQTHRVAFALYHGVWPDGVVDHINGDARDNRRENLRVCTPAQNAMNRRYPKQPGDLPQGVGGSKGHYWAKLQHKGVSHREGPFETAEEAHAAYKNLSNRLRGEFSPYWTSAA